MQLRDSLKYKVIFCSKVNVAQRICNKNLYFHPRIIFKKLNSVGLMSLLNNNDYLSIRAPIYMLVLLGLNPQHWHARRTL